MMRKRIAALALAALVLVCIGVEVAAATSNARTGRSDTSRVRGHALSRSITKNLSVFRHARLASDDIPAAARLFEAQAINHVDDLEWGASRRADTPTGPMFLVPGASHICQVGAGIACGPTSHLAIPGSYILRTISGGFNPLGTVTVSGIVPDTVRSIDASTANGRTIVVEVRENAFSQVVPREVDRLAFHLRNGKTVRRTLGQVSPSAPTDAPATRARLAR